MREMLSARLGRPDGALGPRRGVGQWVQGRGEKGRDLGAGVFAPWALGRGISGGWRLQTSLQKILPVQLIYKLEDIKSLQSTLNINRIQDLEANTKLK